jgi:hypothetical protein
LTKNKFLYFFNYFIIKNMGQEPKIKFENPKDNRETLKEKMPLEKAQEEANIMRVIASDENKSSLREFEKPRTKEEYDKALKVLEQLKQLIKEEPAAEKILGEISRLSIISGYSILSVLDDIAQGSPLRYLYPKEYQNNPQKSTFEILDADDKALKRIENVSAKLKYLREKGNFLGDLENTLTVPKKYF